jgi:hypothetical protein
MDSDSWNARVERVVRSGTAELLRRMLKMDSLVKSSNSLIRLPNALRLAAAPEVVRLPNALRLAAAPEVVVAVSLLADPDPHLRCPVPTPPHP